MKKNLAYIPIFILLALFLVVFAKDFVLKGIREGYCLNQAIKKYGIQEPMAGKKWEIFTNCFNSFRLSDLLDYFRRK